MLAGESLLTSKQHCHVMLLQTHPTAYLSLPQVRVRPTSMKKKKPSALDKQYRHVALLQRHNRRAAAQATEQVAEQQRQQRELAGTCQQLRANILAGGAT